MPDTLRRFLIDLVVLFFVALAWLSLSGAEAKGLPYSNEAEKAEWRGARYARETITRACTESCRAQCPIDCAKVPR